MTSACRGSLPVMALNAGAVILIYVMYYYVRVLIYGSGTYYIYCSLLIVIIRHFIVVSQCLPRFIHSTSRQMVGNSQESTDILSGLPTPV